MTNDNPKGGGQSRKRAGGKAGGAPGPSEANPTANTSLTPPGPAPQTMQSGRRASGARDQFGQESQTGQGADLTEQMDSAGPGAGSASSEPDLIPWDPTGKIDDEVERRTRQPAATGGGASPSPGAGRGGASAGGQAGGAARGPDGSGGSAAGQGGQQPDSGGYGGGAETLSANRYADATDEAPTDPEEGATTTLASLAAEDLESPSGAADRGSRGAAPRPGQPTAPRKAPSGSSEVH
jgi:hypothetical protein